MKKNVTDEEDIMKQEQGEEQEELLSSSGSSSEEFEPIPIDHDESCNSVDKDNQHQKHGEEEEYYLSLAEQQDNRKTSPNCHHRRHHPYHQGLDQEPSSRILSGVVDLDQSKSNRQFISSDTYQELMTLEEEKMASTPDAEKSCSDSSAATVSRRHNTTSGKNMKQPKGTNAVGSHNQWCQRTKRLFCDLLSEMEPSIDCGLSAVAQQDVNGDAWRQLKAQRHNSIESTFLPCFIQSAGSSVEETIDKPDISYYYHRQYNPYYFEDTSEHSCCKSVNETKYQHTYSSYSSNKADYGNSAEYWSQDSTTKTNYNSYYHHSTSNPATTTNNNSSSSHNNSNNSSCTSVGGLEFSSRLEKNECNLWQQQQGNPLENKCWQEHPLYVASSSYHEHSHGQYSSAYGVSAYSHYNTIPSCRQHFNYINRHVSVKKYGDYCQRDAASIASSTERSIVVPADAHQYYSPLLPSSDHHQIKYDYLLTPIGNVVKDQQYELPNTDSVNGNISEQYPQHDRQAGHQTSNEVTYYEQASSPKSVKSVLCQHECAESKSIDSSTDDWNIADNTFMCDDVKSSTCYNGYDWSQNSYDGQDQEDICVDTTMQNQLNNFASSNNLNNQQTDQDLPEVPHKLRKLTDGTTADIFMSMGNVGYFPGLPLVHSSDKKYATKYSYGVMKEVMIVLFDENDRRGKRQMIHVGFPGIACRHCHGMRTSMRTKGFPSYQRTGRYFPSTLKSFADTKKTLNAIFSHLMKCDKCPKDVKDELLELEKEHKAERASKNYGSQSRFFARIWNRLHGKNCISEATPSAGILPIFPSS